MPAQDDPENVIILFSALTVLRNSLQAYPQFEGDSTLVMLIVVDNNNTFDLLPNASEPDLALSMLMNGVGKVVSESPLAVQKVKPQ